MKLRQQKTLHWLQICNVGSIVGGTAACAWTISQAFPDCRHTVLFFNRLTDETRKAFSHCVTARVHQLSLELVNDISPDVVILHNTSASRISTRIPVPTLVYLHSHIKPAEGDFTVYCSNWLAKRFGNVSAKVLYQPVPRPISGEDISFTPGANSQLRVGRICTPSQRKWPVELISFYQQLASHFPQVIWEFVGCPKLMQADLTVACNGRVQFYNAAWKSRQYFCHWDIFMYHHPTLTESFGRTVAEAMRSGCVPVVDERGGFKEQVRPDCGFLCSSVAGFKFALQQLNNPDVRHAMSSASKARADRLFSLASFRKNILTLFRRESAHNLTFQKR